MERFYAGLSKPTVNVITNVLIRDGQGRILIEEQKMK